MPVGARSPTERRSPPSVGHLQPGGEHPHFFTGRLAQPDRTAKMLLALMSVVPARFRVPSAMLERILTESDPVVTSSDDRLGFEGFSALRRLRSSRSASGGAPRGTLRARNAVGSRTRRGCSAARRRSGCGGAGEV